jgi:hypothetical protein
MEEMGDTGDNTKGMGDKKEMGEKGEMEREGGG